MTEKRFEIKKGYIEHIIENENNHPRIPHLFVSTQEVVDRLNELYEANEQLKQFIKQSCPMCRANLELFYKEWRCEND